MRWLKHLIPEETKNSLNANPGFQWLVIVIMFVVGALLIGNGIRGVKTKMLQGKNGRVFTGTTAQLLGIVYVLLGVALPIVAIASKV
ncbi:MAG: hypothetical protein AAF298_27805 [Cyanobacteria bacterium P01_A01_bin.40]